MLTPAQGELQTAVHQGKKRGDLWCELRLAKRSSSISFNTSYFRSICRGGAVLSIGRVTIAWRKELGHLVCEQAKWTAAVLLSRELVASREDILSRFLFYFFCTRTTIPGCWNMASASSIAASIASKTKTKKKHFVAQKVKLFRASDPLLSVVMWGVNHSVSRIS